MSCELAQSVKFQGICRVRAFENDHTAERTQLLLAHADRAAFVVDVGERLVQLPSECQTMSSMLDRADLRVPLSATMKAFVSGMLDDIEMVEVP